MMSIDEAIDGLKRIFSNYELDLPCTDSLDIELEIIVLLEELKALKNNSISIEAFERMKSKSYKKGHRQGYNKAIDDFTDKLKSECTEHYIDCDPYFGGIEDRILYEYDIEEIAEQLKAGGTNDEQ